MDDRLRRRDELAKLALAITEGRIDRRAFTRRALALGLSLPAIGAIFRTYAVRAQESENPITITVGGETTLLVEEDLEGVTPGGTLRFARAEDSDNLDPVTNDGNVNIWIFMNIYNQLDRSRPRWRFAGAGSGRDLGGLRGRQDLHLPPAPGVSFSDGTPLKASDVMYSYVRAANDPTWNFTLTALAARRQWAGRRESRRRTTTTVVIELAQPWAPFLSDVAMFNMSIISEAFAKGNEDRLTRSAWGPARSQLAEWKQGRVHPANKELRTTGRRGCRTSTRSSSIRCRTTTPASSNCKAARSTAMYNVPTSRVAELKQDPNLKVIEFPSTYSHLHHAQPAGSAARRRQRPPGPAVRDRQAGADRGRPLRRRDRGDVVHAEGRALLERHAARFPLRPRQGEGADGAVDDAGRLPARAADLGRRRRR